MNTIRNYDAWKLSNPDDDRRTWGDDETPLHEQIGFDLCDECQETFSDDDIAETAGGHFCLNCLREMTFGADRIEWDADELQSYDRAFRNLDPWMFSVYQEAYKQRTYLAEMLLEDLVGKFKTWMTRTKWILSGVRRSEDRLLVSWRVVESRGNLWTPGDEMTLPTGPEIIADRGMAPLSNVPFGEMDWTVVERYESHGPDFWEVGLQGIDDLGREFSASGFTFGDEIVEISDVERY